MATVDVLIPSFQRAAALAITLTSLALQDFTDFRVIISDQTDAADANPFDAPEVRAVFRLLEAKQIRVETHKHLPARGMAEHRQFLFEQATADYALFLDNDLILEPDVVGRMFAAIKEESCGFVGCAVIGLKYKNDARPHEQHIEFWTEKVEPETVLPASDKWNRYRLHNAANVLHVAANLGLTPANQRKYKIAWVGGCVLYDAAKLRAVGGFEFWRKLPSAVCGEEVLPQQRLMRRFGGCAILPSGVYHLELSTTIENRRFDAPQILRGDGDKQMPKISVLMPTFNQANFIARAIDSLRAQSFSDWELVIFDDGSTDETRRVIARFVELDARIRYYESAQNHGLGKALNECLQRAAAEIVAYLPSDDVYYSNHLQSLFDTLTENETAVLAFSGVRHHYNKTAAGKIENYSLQLVQVAHRLTKDRWLEREELVSDDSERLFFNELRAQGEFVGTNLITCEWVDHPAQLHKIVREPEGGINLFRRKFNIQHPLRFHTSVGNKIDEFARYQHFRERPDTAFDEQKGLKILLVGELAYNADRVLALEERGHKLFGLWLQNPYWYNTVGKLPFGHCEDLDFANWQNEIERVEPDVVYALLNWQAVPLCREVLRFCKGRFPFVWHYKEGPFISLEKGHWNDLTELYLQADANIYCSPEMFEWQKSVTPDVAEIPSLILDGDLPKADWFANKNRSPSLSAIDNEIHTVVPGRPIGLHPETVAELAANQIHLHFYGDFTHGQWLKWIERTKSLAGRFIHIHANVDQENWTTEFSKYDAGWLHFFKSENAGDIRRANWDDLNFPARMATLAVSGLPFLQGDNAGAIVATQTLAREKQLGLFFKDMSELAKQLNNREHLNFLRENVWRQRAEFTFDFHAEKLLDFFRKTASRNW